MKRAAAAGMLALSLSLSACSSIDQAAFARYQARSPIKLSQQDAPAGVEPLGLVWSQSTGFYLLGLLAIVPADLETALDLLVESARDLKADGIARIRIDYKPASFFSFDSWPVPFPWFATVSLSGMAWKGK